MKKVVKDEKDLDLSHIRNLPIVGELLDERYIVLEVTPHIRFDYKLVPHVLVYDIEQMDYRSAYGIVWMAEDKRNYEVSFDFRSIEDRIYELY